MHMKLNSVRREYKFAELSRSSIDPDPIRQFEQWLKDALDSKVNEPTAMSLITLEEDGFPHSRIVLLKDFNEDGFTFFTNYNSKKARAIANNSSVGLHFFWSELERQVRISGLAIKSTKEVSERYFKSRPITSQIAAIVSNQSEEIPSREYLENRFFDLQDQLHGETPEMPESWGGYVVQPQKMEFWQGRESRLHDRILYSKENDNWITKRLAP